MRPSLSTLARVLGEKVAGNQVRYTDPVFRRLIGRQRTLKLKRWNLFATASGSSQRRVGRKRSRHDRFPLSA
jgi:hypothetical protein